MIHKTAIIEKGVKIGARTKIWAWVHIVEGALIGHDVTIGERVYIGRNVKIGDGCKIQTGAFIPEGVILGDRVFVGPNVMFTNVKYPYANVAGNFEQTVINEDTRIGAGAIILPGLCVGRSVCVGAGAVVTKDVRSGACVKGVPAHE